MRIFLLAMLLLLGGCSSKTPPNMWQYKTHNSYKSFEKYYLEYKLDLAAISLKRAREYASQSADLSTLAQIELSVCALKVALLEPYSCQRYEKLESLIDSDALTAYDHFLKNTLSEDELSDLPEQYKDFAQARLHNDKEQMLKEVPKITPLTSKMITASLIQEELPPKLREAILQEISFHGYTYGTITWLTFEIEHTEGEAKKRELQQKLEVIYSFR